MNIERIWQENPLLKNLYDEQPESRDNIMQLINQMAATPTELEERFQQFHEDNPWIYEQLVAEARKVVKKGYTHYGCRTIFENLRHNSVMDTEGSEAVGYKMNNDFCALYSRKIMEENYDLQGLFETREMKR